MTTSSRLGSTSRDTSNASAVDELKEWIAALIGLSHDLSLAWLLNPTPKPGQHEGYASIRETARFDMQNRDYSISCP